jgi:2-methylaconitate cis-trans-isomerase PrpF
LRGGTSKAIFLRDQDIPEDQALRDRIILDIFGSPDLRQIDGLGGADLLTSKVAIISEPSRPDADADYTFGQVSLDRPIIDYTGNCGNISTAVGPFAIYQGMVKATDPLTTVRIHNTNTNMMIIAEVPTTEGYPVIQGDYHIHGVPQSGARINLDFSQTVGSSGFGFLPTGKSQEEIYVDGMGMLRVSIVDAANPIVFVYAQDLGLTGGEVPSEIANDPETMGMLEAIRAAAAEKMGLVSDRNEALEKSPFRPFIAFVSEPKDSQNIYSGGIIPGKDISFRARMLAMQMVHQAYAGTGSICTAAASKITGTIVNEVSRSGDWSDSIVRIGHPAGWMEVDVELENRSDGPILKRAVIGRHARKILDGYVYVRESVFDLDQ